MAKVIKHGKYKSISLEKYQNCICNRCGCEFSVTLSDLNDGNISDDLSIWIIDCPECNLYGVVEIPVPEPLN